MTHPNLIIITSRLCAPRLQPNIQVGQLHTVVGTDQLKDGTEVLLLHNPKDKRKPFRINAKRFQWKHTTPAQLRESKFRRECAKSTKEIQNNFIFQEHVYIAFVPQILATLAFQYAKKCRTYAADHKIGILRKLARAYDEVEKNYTKELSKDLDAPHRAQIKNQTGIFMQKYANDFTILWYSVNREFLRFAPEWPYADMRTDAILGMLMIQLYREHSKQVDTLIQSRLGGWKNSVKNPLIEALYSVLDAYAGEVDRFNFNNQDIMNGKKVIFNRIKQIKFSLTA